MLALHALDLSDFHQTAKTNNKQDQKILIYYFENGVVVPPKVNVGLGCGSAVEPEASPVRGSEFDHSMVQ